MAAAVERQAEVIAALRSVEHGDVANRLARCMSVHVSRRADPAAARIWPWRCGLAGCVWCGRTHQNRAWGACLRWGRGLAARSIVVIPLPHRPGELRDAIKAVRRALRDARDTESSKSRRWLDVGFGGVTVGDSVWLVALHDRLDRQELARVLRRRWPSAQVSADMSAPLPFGFTTSDLAELGLARRGAAEPTKVTVGLRQVEFGQQDQQDAGKSAVLDQPMPFTWQF